MGTSVCICTHEKTGKIGRIDLFSQSGTLDAEVIMARRRKIEEEVVQDAVAESPSARKVIAIRLNEDGKVDLASMRTATREALRVALEGSDLTPDQDAANAHAASLEARKAVYAQVVPALYAVFGAAESLIVAKKTELPYSEVREVMTYSDAEIGLLLDPTATVLAKRMPDGFGWTEEVTLVLILVSIHQQKVSMLQEVKARNEKRLVDIRPAVPEAKDSIGQ